MLNLLLEAAGIKVFERGWLSSNNVLFDDADAQETLLVDTGYCTHGTQTVALVRQALGSRCLHRVINTHLHADHCGGNQALQLAFDCFIDVPAGEADKVDRWDEAALTYHDTGQQCPRFERTGSIRDGDEIRGGKYGWRVMSAPGHDPESIVLYQPDLEILISADALWENGFGVVFPELEGEHAFGDVRATLERIGQLSIKCVIPGHGAPFQHLEPALARAYSRLEGFVADPKRHARHAAKVLIKFHLLEVQKSTFLQLFEWLGTTKYMRLTHIRHFGSAQFDVWCADLIQELASSGVISIQGNVIVNG
jgi:glyoxylase-like metal-dependent hydrolase (beta-lactamase superfamily II)